MAVEPLPAAQSAERPFSCLDQMKRIKAAPHGDGRAFIYPSSIHRALKISKQIEPQRVFRLREWR